jgi:hypothetical protein
VRYTEGRQKRTHEAMEINAKCLNEGGWELGSRENIDIGGWMREACKRKAE